MIDALTPIAEFMAAEINTNARSMDVIRMRELHAYSAQTCIEAWLQLPIWQKALTAGVPSQCMDIATNNSVVAMLIRAKNARTGSNWDHKPIIAKKFMSASNRSRYWHCHDDQDWFYDVWSNIHYGYVGAAAKSSESELLDGAGLEQTGSNALHGRATPRAPNVNGMRAWDDPADQEAIARGMYLQKVIPIDLTAGMLLDNVLGLKLATRRPHVDAIK